MNLRKWIDLNNCINKDIILSLTNWASLEWTTRLIRSVEIYLFSGIRSTSNSSQTQERSQVKK